jgi:alpha-methylacyl-CoA racemase
MQAVMAILAALVRRGTTGEGAYLDVAIVEGVLSLTSLYIDEYLATGAVPGPGHNILTGRYACYDTYQCADGAWVAVGAIEPAFYSNLCRVLGCDEHADGQLDDARQPAIRAAFTAAFASKPRDEWLHAALGADACISPVWSVPDLVDDPQLRARGVFVEAEHPTAGTFRQLGPLLAGMDKTPRTHAVPDASVTHTDALLTEAGLRADEVASLRERGVVA